MQRSFCPLHPPTNKGKGNLNNLGEPKQVGTPIRSPTKYKGVGNRTWAGMEENQMFTHAMVGLGR